MNTHSIGCNEDLTKISFNYHQKYHQTRTLSLLLINLHGFKYKRRYGLILDSLGPGSTPKDCFVME